MNKALVLLVVAAIEFAAAAQTDLVKTATVDVGGIEAIVIDAQVADVRLTSGATAAGQGRSRAQFPGCAAPSRSA